MRGCRVWTLAWLLGTLAVHGCSDGGAPQAPGETARHRGRLEGLATSKRTPPLELRFEDPVDVKAGGRLAMTFYVEGTPGERVTVRLFGSAGVDLYGDGKPVSVDLGEDGRAALEVSGRAPIPADCAIVARVTRENGTACEARCVVGRGPHASSAPDVRRTSSGEEARLVPSG